MIIVKSFTLRNMNRPDEILDRWPPKEICDAARLVEHYFEEQGAQCWEFMGLCSRNHADLLRRIQGEIDDCKIRFNLDLLR